MKGPIAWMARNPVASNLLMALLMIGGLVMGFTKVKQEVFPEFNLDVVSVTVAYPGSSPEEVEQGMVLAVEEAVRGLDGVKKVNARAMEGGAGITIELFDGTNGAQALSDIKAAVDRIRSFPVDAERPVIRLIIARRKAISLMIYGDQDPANLRLLADRARDELLQDPRITLVDLSGVQRREIAVELDERTLRAQGISLGQVARAIRDASIELPAGSLKTTAGELNLRTTERRNVGLEFGEITVRSDRQGTHLELADLGEVRDGFVESDVAATFNGQPAVQIDVYRVGEQTPISVADAVKEYAEAFAGHYPDGVKLATFNDRSEIFRGRADLLKRNALMGLALVFVALGLFLELRLAFWVMMGIPISFLGAFLLMPALDVSINMISMFAFIVTLGIVVDDAIVVGENIYEKQSLGIPPEQAAIEGARQVSTPVIFAVLTTVAAFGPLFFVPGVTGKFFRVIPAIVVAVILISLIESLFVLPAHLAHLKPPKETGIFGFIHHQQQKVGRALQWFIDRAFKPVLMLATRYRYITFAQALAMMLVAVGVVKGGHLDFTFMPKVESDIVTASARLPLGAPIEETRRIKQRMLADLDAVLAEHGGRERLTRGVFALEGAAISRQLVSTGGGGSHMVDIQAHLVPSGERNITAHEVARAWRKRSSNLVGVDRTSFSGSMRTGGGVPIDILLSHRDTHVLERAATQLAQGLKTYEGASDVDAGFTGGKSQFDLTLKPAARSLGLTERALARQVRDAFFGAEALRQQRGRDEVRVLVRLPRADRRRLTTFENLILQLPGGGEIPLVEAAWIKRGLAKTTIQRENGRRVLHVTADVDRAKGNAEKILARVETKLLPGLLADNPGMTYSLEGASRDRKETFAALGLGFMIALLTIYALLAVPFRSYLQPLVIMIAIPFGFIGAVAGHLLTGYDMSVISMMGVVALQGIVVNDSLILVVEINHQIRENGLSPYDAVIRGATRRFRPILLTSLTTFLGLMPMIFETSVQARFLIPMAISLGFGVLFATVLILLVVPGMYLILDDLKRLWRFIWSPIEPPAADPPPLSESP